jgi:hypothetical protein
MAFFANQRTSFASDAKQSGTTRATPDRFVAALLAMTANNEQQ